MSIVVCCNLPDGIIIGADSAATVSGTVVDESTGATQHGVLKVFERARKVFQLGKLPVGLAAFGVSQMGERTVGSYIEQFELDRLDEVARDGRVGDTLEELCAQMWDFLHEQHRSAFADVVKRAKGREYDDVPAGDRPALVAFVAGYGTRKPLGEVWEVRVHDSERAQAIRKLRVPGNFGADWGGVAGPVTRFIHGYDPGLRATLDRILKKHVADKYDEVWPEVQQELARLEYAIPYGAMPLEDGIEHVRYLTGLAISFARFVAGPPVCGGDVRLACITPRKGFTWVTE